MTAPFTAPPCRCTTIACRCRPVSEETTRALRQIPRSTPPPTPDPGALARLNVPAPAEDWWALCDAWGVPRNPDALVRAIQAATWDRATTAYIADSRAREEA